jgi:ribosomal protein S27E
MLGVDGAGSYFMEIACKTCGRKDRFFNKEANKMTRLLKE